MDGARFMARTPEEVIERLKGEVALARLVDTAVVTLKRHGADLLGLCPFYDIFEVLFLFTNIEPGETIGLSSLRL